MIDDLRAIGDGDRRSGTSFRLGRVEETRFDLPMTRVRVRLDTEVLTDWLPWTTWAAGRLRVWSPPTEGEQCAVIAPSGEPHLGIAAPALFTAQFPAPSDDPELTLLQWQPPDDTERGDTGAFIEVHRNLGTLRLHAPCGVWVAGDLCVTGRLRASDPVPLLPCEPPCDLDLLAMDDASTPLDEETATCS